MFRNIGGKIKTLAQIITWLGIIASVLGGFIVAAIDDDLIAVGLLIVVVGSLASWISSFLLYGYGQLIQNTDIIASAVRQAPYHSAPTQPSAPVQASYAPQPQAAPVQAPHSEKAELLAKWRAEGLITEEEYQNKMASL